MINAPARRVVQGAAQFAAISTPLHPAQNLRPDDLAILQIDPSRLAEDWQNRPDLTGDLGTDWLKNAVTSLLEIPIAIVPETKNFLFNPLHHEAARCKIVATQS
jgi:hypothetical protein